MANVTNITNLLTQTTNPRIGVTANLPYGDAQLFPLLAVGDRVQIGCFSGQVYVSCADWVATDGYIPHDAEPYTEGPFHDPPTRSATGPSSSTWTARGPTPSCPPAESSTLLESVTRLA